MIIFNQAIKRIFKNKTRLLVLIIMPLLFIMMFALQEERYLTIGIVDKDGSLLSNKLIEHISEMDRVKVELLEEKRVYDKIVSYQVDYTLIIEPDFQEKLIKGENPGIKEFYLNEKEKLFYARNSVENFIYTMKTLAAGASFMEDRFEDALAAYESGKMTLVNESADDKKIIQTRAATGFLVQFMLYMSVITAGLVIEDKSSGIFYRIFYAPVTLKRYIVENLLAFMLVGIMQVTIVMGLMKFVLGMEFGRNPMNIYVLFLLFSIVCISFGMWMISLFKKPMEAYISIILSTTPLVMLGGCYWPMEFMPEIFQKIALFIPTTWVMAGVDKILYNGKNIPDLYLEFLVLLIFAGIFLAAGLFKKIDVSK